MDEKQIEEISKLLTGLKRYEWSRLKIAVETMFDSASAKLELDDTESLRRTIAMQFKSIID